MPAASTALRSPHRARVLPRVCQISEYHCGPAVVQMLLAQRGVRANQDRLTELAEIQATIDVHGARVDQLARAVERLREDVCLWHKDRASLDDLVAALRRYHSPVGVEWQGFFEEREEDEDFDAGDYGHYSIVTRVDLRRGLVTLRDPYPDFCHEDRVFKLQWFVKRWWDVNLAPVSSTGILQPVEDRHLLFVIAGKRATFPAALGMTRG
ncbi:MAG: hypothetical protein ACM30E_00320 [Nitrososphaerales archaeon]